MSRNVEGSAKTSGLHASLHAAGAVDTGCCKTNLHLSCLAMQQTSRVDGSASQHGNRDHKEGALSGCASHRKGTGHGC